MLAIFKNALFDSEELEENQYVPMKVWNDVGEYEMNRLLKGDLNDLLLSEIKDGNKDRVNLNKFNDIVDLFFYLPKKSKKNARNESENMWYICSSNVHGSATAKEVAVQGGRLK